MENAADALKIAFAIFIFVIAITVTFSIISQVKSTADVVLYHTDETNFYGYSNSKKKNRSVSVPEIISTLYRYNNESISVAVQLKSDVEYIFDVGRETIVKQDGTIDSNPNGEKKVNTPEQKQQNLVNFIKYLEENYSDASFTEIFIEAQIGSIYEAKEKIYITYILENE